MSWLNLFRTSEAAGSEMSPDELLARLASACPPFLLDVRRPEEFAEGRIPGAINISHDQLAGRLTAVAAGDKDGEVVVYCRSGARASTACALLRAAGYTRVRHLAGDMNGWLRQGRMVEL